MKNMEALGGKKCPHYLYQTPVFSVLFSVELLDNEDDDDDDDNDDDQGTHKV